MKNIETMIIDGNEIEVYEKKGDEWFESTIVFCTNTIMIECSINEFFEYAVFLLWSRENLIFCKKNKKIDARDKIELAEKKISNHTIETSVKDNMLCVRYDFISYYFYETEFEIFTVQIEKLLINFFEHIRIMDYDYSFLNRMSAFFLKTKSVSKGVVRLSDLLIWDDSGLCYIEESDRVKALYLKKNIDDCRLLESNRPYQKNSDRLQNALNVISNLSYPKDTGYICTIKGRNGVIDGRHRASCLYYLYGDIEVEVKMFDVCDMYLIKECIPFDKIPSKSKIVLYGAGENGKRYFYQAKKKYNIVAWCDKKYEQINDTEIEVISPSEAIEKEFDYVLISIMDNKECVNVKKWLINSGINEKIIVTP